MTDLGVQPTQLLTLNEKASIYVKLRELEQDEEKIEPPVPLTLSEKQVIYGQLRELRIVRIELDRVKTHEAEERRQYEAEKKYWQDRIESERKLAEIASQKIVIAEKERDLALDKVQFYQTALNVCQGSKKKGFWCGVKKFFSFGIARCK